MSIDKEVKKKASKSKKTFFKETGILSKDWWIGLGVIISFLGVLTALIFSLINYNNNKVIEQENKLNKIENKRNEEIRKLKDNARDWFEDCEYTKSFESYLELKKLDSKDVEGYRKFLNKGKNLKAIGYGKCDSIIKVFFIRAQQLKETPEINKLLQQCD